MRKVEDMNTVDMADLRRRVEENVAALYAGEDLPHQFTEEESLALRPEEDYGSGGFGIHSDGRVAHCGNALMGMSELDIHLLNDGMRIEAGFSPKNSPEEIRKMMRAEEIRKMMRAEAHLQRKAQEASDRQSFRVRVLVLAVALVVFWWLFVR
jgi:hypothetical protein